MQNDRIQLYNDRLAVLVTECARKTLCELLRSLDHKQPENKTYPLSQYAIKKSYHT